MAIDGLKNMIISCASVFGRNGFILTHGLILKSTSREFKKILHDYMELKTVYKHGIANVTCLLIRVFLQLAKSKYQILDHVATVTKSISSPILQSK